MYLFQMYPSLQRYISVPAFPFDLPAQSGTYIHVHTVTLYSVHNITILNYTQCHVQCHYAPYTVSPYTCVKCYYTVYTMSL